MSGLTSFSENFSAKCAKHRRKLTARSCRGQKPNSNDSATATQWGGVENILIMRMDAIGDMVLTSGFIREVRVNFPHAYITLVAESLTYSMVEFCPYVNEVLAFDRKKSLPGNLIDDLEAIALFCRQHFWQKKISLAFSPKTGAWKIPALWMMWLSGARERIGYGLKNYRERSDNVPVKVNDLDRFLLTKNPILPHEGLIPDIEKYFYLLTLGGLKIRDMQPEIFYTATDFYRAGEYLSKLPDSCKKISLGIGASKLNKKYPVQMLVVALNELAKRNFAFVIIGGKSELDDADYLEQNLPQGRVLNLVGKTTLRETEAVIARTNFFIGTDTGVMHMAVAAKVPLIAINCVAKELDALFPSNQFTNFPPNTKKAIILRPAHRLGDCATLPPVYGGCHHKEAHCITQITPQEIVDGFEQLERMT